MNLTNLTKVGSKLVGRSSLILKKYSPEILMYLGIGGVITGTVMACKVSMKVEPIIYSAEEDLKDINKSCPPQEVKKEKTVVFLKTGSKLAKMYTPAMVVGMSSVGLILGSHSIMRKRNVALISAYKLIDKGFTEYRKRVVDEFGETKDRQFKNGIHEEASFVIEEDADGKKKKIKKMVEVSDPNGPSVYAKFFDESSTQWSKTPEFNLIFLRAQQNMLNDMLHAKGNVFLNEVYTALGIPKTQAGAIVGWVMDNGDNFIDFGIFDLENEKCRDFVNGYERSILLDFNVDGVIYDLI